MYLYSGMTSDFVGDATRNRIAGKLEDAFFEHFRFHPSPGEVRSWQNSLRAMSLGEAPPEQFRQMGR
jgi:uncharacterized protein